MRGDCCSGRRSPDRSVFTAWPAGPINLSFDGETVYAESDVPGVNSARQTFDALAYFDAGGSGHSTCSDVPLCQSTPTSSRYLKTFNGTCTTFQSWTA